MAGISVKLKEWWQERGSPRGPEGLHVPQDMLHLFRLRREHRLLRVKISGLEGDFQSLLLEVELRGQRLLLDEPFPQRVPLDALVGRRIQVASIEGDASTRFDSSILGVDRSQASPMLSLALPTNVLAGQRRNAYRLTVDEHTATEAILRKTGVSNLTARVLDLSIHGIRIEVPGHHSELVNSSAPLFLRLGSEQGMLCQLHIRSLQTRLADGETTLLGGRFDGLNPPQLQLIERFIVRSQRAQRQRELALAN